MVYVEMEGSDRSAVLCSILGFCCLLTESLTTDDLGPVVQNVMKLLANMILKFPS